MFLFNRWSRKLPQKIYTPHKPQCFFNAERQSSKPVDITLTVYGSTSRLIEPGSTVLVSNAPPGHFCDRYIDLFHTAYLNDIFCCSCSKSHWMTRTNQEEQFWPVKTWKQSLARCQTWRKFTVRWEMTWKRFSNPGMKILVLEIWSWNMYVFQ